MDQALQLLACNERFTRPLMLNLLPTDEGVELVPAAPDVDPIITEAISTPQVEGEVPPRIPDQQEYSTTASLSLGLDNQDSYTRLST